MGYENLFEWLECFDLVLGFCHAERDAVETAERAGEQDAKFFGSTRGVCAVDF